MCEVQCIHVLRGRLPLSFSFARAGSFVTESGNDCLDRGERREEREIDFRFSVSYGTNIIIIQITKLDVVRFTSQAGPVTIIT